MLVWGCHPSVARADGDPASDVLATQALFLPQDTGASPAQGDQLSALLRSAGRRGYPIRVALIASAGDLGSVSVLWRRPQIYARFLGQELGLVYKGPLLVVMPGGFGLYHAGHGAEGQSALAGVPAPAAGAGLTRSAIGAVQRIAAASGHAVPLPRVAAAPSSAASSDTTAWIAFAIGVTAIVLAWALSIRARPVRLGRRSV